MTRLLILASLLVSCSPAARAPCPDVQACIDARIAADRELDIGIARTIDDVFWHCPGAQLEDVNCAWVKAEGAK